MKRKRERENPYIATLSFVTVDNSKIFKNNKYGIYAPEFKFSSSSSSSSMMMNLDNKKKRKDYI